MNLSYNNAQNISQTSSQNQLKQYSLRLSKEKQPLQRLILQTLIATVHINLGNYNESYQKCLTLQKYIQKWQNQSNQIQNDQKSVQNQILLLKIKVYTNLIIIQLINCQKKILLQHLQKLLKVILSTKTKKNTKIDLFQNDLLINCFQTALLNIYGFSSFQQLDSYCLSFESISINDIHKKGYGIIYSILSMMKQLMNKNLDSALQLQLLAFSKYKVQKNSIMMTMSIKHIIQISKKLNIPKEKMQIYQQAFHNLMNSKQLKGLLQQTIFRNFEQKMELGVNITQILMNFQSQNVNPLRLKTVFQDKKWITNAIRYRLRQSLNENNQKQINNLLKMTQNNPDKIINFLRGNVFVKHAIEQYKEIVQVIINCLQQLILQKKRKGFALLKDYKSIKNNTQQQNSIQIQIIDIKKQSKQQKKERNHIKKQQSFIKQQVFQERAQRSLNYSEQEYNHLPISNSNYHYKDKKYEKNQQQTIFIPNQNNLKQTSKFYVQPSPLSKQINKKQESPKRNNQVYTQINNQEKLKNKLQKSNQNQFKTNYLQQLKGSPKNQQFSLINNINSKKQQQLQQNLIKKQKQAISHRQNNLSPSKNQIYLHQTARIQPQILSNFLKTSQLQRNQQSNIKFSFNQPYDLNKVNLNKTINKQILKAKDRQVLQNQKKQVQMIQQRKPNFYFEKNNNNQDSNILSISKISSRTKKSLSPKIPKQSTIKIYKQTSHLTSNSKSLKSQQIKKMNQNLQTFNASNKQSKSISYNQWAAKTLNNKNIQTKSKSKLQNLNRDIILNNQKSKQRLKNDQKETYKKTQSFDDLQKPTLQNESQLLNNLRKIAQVTSSQLPKKKQQNIKFKQQAFKNKYASALSKQKQNNGQKIQQKQYFMSKQKDKYLNKSNLSQKKEKRRKKFQQKMKHLIKLCHYGQYVDKRFQTSDGGDQRFLRLSEQNNYLQYANDQSKILSSGSRKQYLIEDICGLIYGKVTSVFLKDCNRKLESYKCFSIIFPKHTLNFHCSQEKDLLFWLPGISYYLENNRRQLFTHKNYSNLIQKYTKKQKSNLQSQKSLQSYRRRNFYSVGRVLWKKILLILQDKYIGPKLKKQHKYKNANAYAIKKFGQEKFGMVFKKEK